MKKYLLLAPLVLLSFIGIAQHSVRLDDIQYHFTNADLCRKAMTPWELVFKARQIHDLHQREVATERMMLNPNEPTVQFKHVEGITPLANATQEPPVSYGLYWLAVSTKNLRKSVAELVKLGCRIAQNDLQLPLDQASKAVLLTTPDGQHLALVQREELRNTFDIDHVQLMVRHLEASIQFFENLLGAQVIRKQDRSACLQVGNQQLMLSEPEALGLLREEVTLVEKVTLANAGASLGFLCDDLEPIYYATKANHLSMLLEPKNRIESDASYISCVVLSPDNLPIELKEEDDRDWKNKTVKRTMRLK